MGTKVGAKVLEKINRRRGLMIETEQTRAGLACPSAYGRRGQEYE